MGRAVRRSSRLIDLVSLVLIVGGASLYIHAYVGMEAIRTARETPFVRDTMEAFELTNKYLRYEKRSYIGLGLVGAGVVVGLSAAAHAHNIRRREAAENPLQG
jgi:hypothetical protein